MQKYIGGHPAETLGEKAKERMHAHLGLLLWLSAVSPSAFGGFVILVFVDTHTCKYIHTI